jgi:eukaryotic-like serine/threonine-protein kinase
LREGGTTVLIMARRTHPHDDRSMSDIFAQLQASIGDEYALERELPARGAARVFTARQQIFNRSILINVIAPTHIAGADIDRFEIEIERAAAISHPGIVPPLMLGNVDGSPYIISPYVPGATLRERLAENPPLSLEEIVGYLRNVADSLHVAHSNQILHHDLNPDTILLSQRAALITDIATTRALRLARPKGSAFIGDPSYMAPEQLSPTGEPDQHADLYAWGCVAYEMLTGMAPYPRVVRDGKVVDSSSEEPAPISLVRRDVPSTLVRLIMRTLSRDVTSRPASAENLVQVLLTVDVSERAMAERNLTPAYVPVIAAQISGPTSKTTRSLAIVDLKRRDLRRIGAIAAAAVVVLTGTIAFARHVPAPPEEPPMAAPSAGIIAQSAAVLPLASVGGLEGDADFAAGLSTEIAQRLARVGVLIAGTGSARVMVTQGLDPRTVARRLGVASVLTGSVQRNSGAFHISVALLSVIDGATRWSAQYDRPTNELFAVEDEIARAVAAKVQGTPAAEPAAVSVPETTVAEAHESALQGFALAAHGTAPMLQSAITHFQSAIARDSSYARAFGALALSSVRLIELDGLVSDAAVARSSAAANRAIALDSTNADAYAALGYLRALHAENRDAERLFRRAVTLDSGNATTWGWYGSLAAHIGDYATGHARVLRARSLEPLSMMARAWDAQVFFGEGKFDRAEQATRVIPNFDSTSSMAVATRADALMAVSRDSVALVLLKERVNISDGDVASEAHALLAYTYAKAGQEQPARDIMLAMRDAAGGVLPSRATIAATLAALGDIDSAVGVLTKAVARHDPTLFAFNHSRRFDVLRKDPRGAKLFAQIERW